MTVCICQLLVPNISFKPKKECFKVDEIFLLFNTTHHLSKKYFYYRKEIFS